MPKPIDIANAIAGFFKNAAADGQKVGDSTFGADRAKDLQDSSIATAMGSLHADAPLIGKLQDIEGINAVTPVSKEVNEAYLAKQARNLENGPNYYDGPKGYDQLKLPQSHNYYMEFDGPLGKSTHVDAIKALNPGHADFLARQNWPDATKMYRIDSEMPIDDLEKALVDAGIHKP